MIQIYLVLTILTILLIKPILNTSPIYQTPKYLQIRQFSIDMNWTSISSGTNYNVPYKNGFTITGSGIGCIVMTSFMMYPKSDVLFYCITNNVGPSSITIQCKANTQTHITLFTYSYFVVDSTQYNTITKSILLSQNTIPLTTQTGQITKIIPITQSTPNHKYKCFIFLRGIEYKNPIKNYSFNQTCNELNGQYYIKLSILKQIQTSTLHYTIVSFNTYQFNINQNTLIISHIQIYKDNNLKNNILTPFLFKNQTALLAGMKSITISNQYQFYSNAQFPNAQVVYTFGDDMNYQEIQSMYFSYLKCSTPTDFLNAIKLECSETHHGCTQFYQTITFPTITSDIKTANLHPSYKIISYNLATYIELLRYNGTKFIPYYQIPDPSTNGIIDFKMNEDYSRVAFITTTTLYTYAWNGTDYIEQFKYSSQTESPRTFLSFDISSNFKTIALLSKLTSNNNHILSTLLYNSQTQKYSINQSIMPPAVYKVFVRNHGQSAFIFNDKYFYHMILSLPLGRFVSDYQTIYIEQSSVVVDISVAQHSDKIAIEYSRKIPGLKQINYGIKIIQLDPYSKYWIITKISPEIFTPFTNNFHKILLSKYGMDLILKPITGSYVAILSKIGPIVGTPFQIRQIIGKVPGSVYTETINNHALAVSKNLQFIISGDTANSLVLYYCKSIINKPNRIFEIPKASPLSTPIIIPTPTDPIPQKNNSKLIQKLKDQLNKKQTINKIMFSLGLISLSGIIILSLYILYQKSKQPPKTILSTQLDANNPTIINLNLSANDQINNSLSFNQ